MIPLGTMTPVQSRPGSNGNEGIFNIPTKQMQFSVIYPGNSLRRWGLILLQKCSRRILHPQPTELSFYSGEGFIRKSNEIVGFFH